jgi:C-terminal processing protease CtpA/Prc
MPRIGAAQATDADAAGAAEEFAGEQRGLPDTERELERLRAELEQARRQMESAARQITRLDTAGPHAFFAAEPGIPGGPVGAGIGANLRDADAGALVIGVTPGGPAAQAGILSGDVISAIAGNPTAGGQQLPVEIVITTLAEAEGGAPIGIDVLRAGEAMTFEVTPQSLPRYARFIRGLPSGDDFEWVMPALPDFDFAAIRNVARDVTSYLDLSELFASRWQDMELVVLTEELGSYFGTDSGLLVVRSPGRDEIDLSDGDVILSISGREPTSPEHAMKILASFVPGEQLELEIMRRQRRQSVEFTIPDPARTGVGAGVGP